VLTGHEASICERTPILKKDRDVVNITWNRPAPPFTPRAGQRLAALFSIPDI
jgi:hypothetical protein